MPYGKIGTSPTGKTDKTGVTKDSVQEVGFSLFCQAFVTCFVTILSRFFFRNGYARRFYIYIFIYDKTIYIYTIREEKKYISQQEIYVNVYVNE